jgi:hypothetical protein
MSNAATDARTTLDEWRASGADRHDPVRFRFIEALERRAAEQSGDARRLLDERLSRLIEAYADQVERSAQRTIDASAEATAHTPLRGRLAELVDLLESRSPANGKSTQADSRVSRRDRGADFEALEYFLEVWSKVNVESQLRQSLEQVPDNAGPLNSESLVHRSLALMREVSPGYLQQFLSYVEALSSLERLNDRSTNRTPPRRSSPLRTPSRSRSSA